MISRSVRSLSNEAMNVARLEGRVARHPVMESMEAIADCIASVHDGDALQMSYVAAYVALPMRFWFSVVSSTRQQ